MTDVAIKSGYWRHATYHDVDDEGEPACKFLANQEANLRVVEIERLPDTAEKCYYCAGRVSETGGDGGKLVKALEEADPDEVSAP
jgi:hypothetical protein